MRTVPEIGGALTGYAGAQGVDRCWCTRTPGSAGRVRRDAPLLALFSAQELMISAVNLH